MPAKGKKHIVLPSLTYLNTTLLIFITLSIPVLLLHGPPHSISICDASSSWSGNRLWSGDLRRVDFPWNRLLFDPQPPPITLKIAVFSRKWPLSSAPGGMERHALTLYSVLAQRGHRIHVYTSAPPSGSPTPNTSTDAFPNVHFLDKSPGKWDYHHAWASFEAENKSDPFDVVHSESVALPHWLARSVPNLAVSWHGIALEALQSKIYQELARKPDEPKSPSWNDTVIPKILTEIRFFHSYAQHVAISDSSGEMLRDVYQIPKARVHVILNGIDDEAFQPDERLGREFRAHYGVPDNASLVVGVSGRLVKEKGHPLLYEAFSKLISKHPGVYLIVAGAGPWEKRYSELGPQVLSLGALPPDKLRAFYNSLDVFVNPTLRTQGLDLTLMEAMMCGKPILATGFPSIKGSIIVDDEFGHTFAPNVESLLEALQVVVEEGPKRLAVRGRACQKYASAMFTAPKMASAYERLFLCMKKEEFCRLPLLAAEDPT
ncbi:uncharacterized protein [Aristolochia californica]|uniref:uncharacterized protein n=1 Tax=Aristolochia californica TaxID=171875 RepID=UPI0035E00A76